jgi:hypothetical protein
VQIYATSGDLDQFAEALQNAWVLARVSARDQWVINAAGCIGGAGAVLKLAALVKRWQLDGHYERAAFALDCLKAIGSDLALSHHDKLDHEVQQSREISFQHAMLHGWRSRRDKFEAHVRHPLNCKFVQHLIWAVYDEQDRVIETFRIAEDWSYADVDEKVVTLSDKSIGVLHPVQVSDDILKKWIEIQGDYGLMPSFTQLGRPHFKPTQEQLSQTEIVTEERLAGSPMTTEFNLRQTYYPHFNQSLKEHTKTTGLTWQNPGTTTLVSVSFYEGYGDTGGKLKLEQVHPILFSEVSYYMRRLPKP